MGRRNQEKWGDQICERMTADTKFITHCTNFNRYLMKAKYDFDLRYGSKTLNTNASIDDFLVLKTLGKGSFGRVVLVRHQTTQHNYAMKIMEKSQIIMTKQLAHVYSEIRAMDAIRFEFLIHLRYFCKDNVYIYLCMPFVNGGEMFKHLRREIRYEESQARFYAGQVVLALEYLHFMGLVYRDLKPENILIDQDGFIKLTDFGFMKKIDNERTYTLCGTPDYLAPEILLSKGYGMAVDWWAVGILVYEMNAGLPPFYSSDPMRVYEKIIKGKFNCPKHFSRQLKDFSQCLIEVDRSKRYGSMKDGVRDIKMHSWFETLDWDSLLMRKIQPPYKPFVASGDDTSQFSRMADIKLRTASREEFGSEFRIIEAPNANPSPMAPSFARK